MAKLLQCDRCKRIVPLLVAGVHNGYTVELCKKCNDDFTTFMSNLCPVMPLLPPKDTKK